MNPHHPLLNNQRGFTLITVLVAVSIIGLSLGLAGSTWRAVMEREREEELLFRGNQYRRAIASYYNVRHGNAPGFYPNKLEDLLKDPRALQTVRHIRKLYKDPFGEVDFEPIRQGDTANQQKKEGTTVVGRIKGVKSTSAGKPFRAGGFPPEFDRFTGATSYQQWEFIYEPVQQPAAGATPETGVVGRPAVPGLSPLSPASDLPLPPVRSFQLIR